MAENRSSEEYGKKLIAVMGQGLGDLFHKLDDHVVWAWLKWKQFEGLFGSPESVALLNEAAPAFFSLLQRTLLQDLVLHVSRLTDRPRVAGKETLSLERLRDAFPDPTLRQKVNALLDELKKKTDHGREH